MPKQTTGHLSAHNLHSSVSEGVSLAQRSLAWESDEINHGGYLVGCAYRLQNAVDDRTSFLSSKVVWTASFLCVCLTYLQPRSSDVARAMRQGSEPFWVRRHGNSLVIDGVATAQAIPGQQGPRKLSRQQSVVYIQVAGYVGSVISLVMNQIIGKMQSHVDDELQSSYLV